MVDPPSPSEEQRAKAAWHLMETHHLDVLARQVGHYPSFVKMVQYCKDESGTRDNTLAPGDRVLPPAQLEAGERPVRRMDLRPGATVLYLSTTANQLLRAVLECPGPGCSRCDLDIETGAGVDRLYLQPAVEPPQEAPRPRPAGTCGRTASPRRPS